MTDPRVSIGEVPCFGHDPEYGVSGSRRRPHYRWDIICAGLFLVGIAASGEIIFLHTTGMFSMVCFVLALGAGLAIAFYIADPIYKSVSVRRRHRKMNFVK